MNCSPRDKHKKLAIERYLVNLLSLLSKHLDDHEDFAIIKKSKLGQFLSAAKLFNETASVTANTDTLRENFLRTNYPNYKQLCDYDVYWAIRYLSQLEMGHPVVALAAKKQQ